MNWKKFLGERIYTELKEICERSNVTIASAVRLAVAEYVGRLKLQGKESCQ